VWDASSDTIVQLVAAGQWLAAALNDGRVKVWSTTTLRPAVTLDDAVHQVGASADGCCLRVVGRRDTVWRMASDGVPARVAMPGGVSGLDVSPAGDRFAAGCGDGTVRVVSLRDGAIERDLKWQDRVIKDVAWSPDGRELATVTSENAPQRVFDAATWSTAWAAGSLGSRRVGWTPTGELVVLPYAMGMLLFGPDHVGRPTGLDLGLWDLVDGDRFVAVHAASGPAWAYAAGHLFALPGVEVAHLVAPLADDFLVVQSNRVNLRTVWGAPIGDWKTQGRATELSASPGGRLFAVGTAEGPIELFAVDRPEPLAVLRGHAAQVAALAWTADGEWLVSGSWDATVRTWWLADLETPAEQLRERAVAAWGWDLDQVLANP
jgi:WD40 repeat protein